MAPKEQLSLQTRIGRLVGTTRKARLISAATVVAFAVAIVAFIALKPKEDTIPRDAYTIAADRLCLSTKGKIVAIERRFERRPGQADTSAFARELVPVVAAWRSGFKELVVPSDRLEQARQLEAALLNVEVQIAGLARVAAQGNKGQVLTSAKRAEAASSAVEEAVASLGLSRCASATIGFAPSTH